MTADFVVDFSKTIQLNANTFAVTLVRYPGIIYVNDLVVVSLTFTLHPVQTAFLRVPFLSSPNFEGALVSLKILNILDTGGVIHCLALA